MHKYFQHSSSQKCHAICQVFINSVADLPFLGCKVSQKSDFSHFQVALTAWTTAPSAVHTNTKAHRSFRPCCVQGRFCQTHDPFSWAFDQVTTHSSRGRPNSQATGEVFHQTHRAHGALNKHVMGDSVLIKAAVCQPAAEGAAGCEAAPNHDLCQALFGTWILWGQRGQVQRSSDWSRPGSNGFICCTSASLRRFGLALWGSEQLHVLNPWPAPWKPCSAAPLTTALLALVFPALQPA